MNDTASSAADLEAMRDEARRIIIERLNKGATLQAAIQAAIAEGIDESVARSVGRSLKDDLVRAKKKRALKSVGFGFLCLIAAPVLGMVLNAAPIPFLHIGLTILFFFGIGRILTAVYDYFTIEGKIR